MKKFIKKFIKHAILVRSQNFPILNLAVPMNIQVVEGVHEDLKFCFQVRSFYLFHLPASVNESTFKTVSHLSIKEIPQSPSEELGCVEI